MICPCCGSEGLTIDTRDVPFVYKHRKTMIKNVTGKFCLSCDEVILDMEQTDAMGRATLEFVQEVNASLVDPGFILQVRKKLGLNQKDATNIFGGGVNAFSRYETGKALPPVALIKLLKVLDRHPDLLDEVRAA